MTDAAGAHVVVGATSEIGRAVAIEVARAFGHVVLAARDAEELDLVAADVHARTGAAVTPILWEATAFERHGEFIDRCVATCGSVEGITLCHGFLADQQAAARDWSLARAMIDVNYSAAVSLLNPFADYFESRGAGYICAVSSVAGDRGRQSNYIYGSTKAALTTYLSGLRNRLHRSGVSVITVKPGFVDTSMTWGKVNPESPLVARPDRIGRSVLDAIRKRKNVIYTPWFWRPIMWIIRSIPEPLFKRLRL